MIKVERLGYVDLGIAPVIIAAGVTAIGKAVGAWLGFRAARQNRIAAERMAAAEIRKAKAAERMAQMQAEVEKARMEERRKAMEFIPRLKQSGVSEEEFALMVSAMYGESPSRVLQELREARKAAGEVPGWAWGVMAALGFMMIAKMKGKEGR